MALMVGFPYFFGLCQGSALVGPCGGVTSLTSGPEGQKSQRMKPEAHNPHQGMLPVTQTFFIRFYLFEVPPPASNTTLPHPGGGGEEPSP